MTPAVEETHSAAATSTNLCIHMESVDRITKLPMVESTVQGGRHVCAKLKELNMFTNWTMSMAERTICKVVKVGRPFAKPIAHTLERPVRCVDGILCKGLDLVERKVPALKLPPEEFFARLYESTMAYIGSNSGGKTACLMMNPDADAAQRVCVMRCGQVMFKAIDEEVKQADEGDECDKDQQD